MKINSLPMQYTPFKEVYVGSNHLTGVQVLFEIRSFVPLLVGAGEVPRIWLSIPADKGGDEWRPLIEDNESLHPKVVVKMGQDSVEVNTPDGVVLEVRRESGVVARVVRIDLRPFGINIYGDEKSLTVMNSVLSRNEFMNVKVMVGIGSGR